MTDLSPAQARIMQFIREYMAEHGIEPTLTEISSAMGWTFAAGTHIAALRRKGYLSPVTWAIRLPGSTWRTRHETTAILNMPSQTLDGWRKRGWIQATRKPNGYYVFPLTEIERILAERSEPTVHFDTLNLERDWCNWFVGFIDGEGTFSMVKQSHHRSYAVTFSVFQRSDHRDVLEDAQRRLTIGHLTERIRNGTTGPGTKYAVTNRRHIIDVIIPLFDKYPPRVKAKTYAIWREAVLLIDDGAWCDHRLGTVKKLHERLREAYQYHAS